MMRLTLREKLLAVVSAIFILAWLLFTFALKPAMARVETLSRVIPQKQEELQRLRAKSKEYIFLRDSLDDLRMKVSSQESAFGGFELLSFLESLIQQGGLADMVVSMKQQELPLDENYYQIIVQIRLEGLTMSQLVDFLRKVEGLPQRGNLLKVFVRTKSLHIRRNPINTDLLDSTVEIHTAKLAQSRIAHR